jgi:large subunit ribosomal protein L7/L12
VLARLGARANWYRLLHGSLAAHAARAATAPAASSAASSAPAAAPPRSPVATAAVAGGPSAYDVVLLEPGDDVIEVVRQLRDATGISLREAKDLVDLHPRAVRRDAPAQEAHDLKRRLEEAGAKIELKPLR